MSDTSTRRWALLIGIDSYSTEGVGKDLDGCTRDIEKVYRVLNSSLNFPVSSITTLIESVGPTTQLGSRKPTRENVRNALDDLETKAKPGDFIYIHYSGHGCRVPTRYTELKGEGAMDEVLCTLEGYITDVELGETFDKLANKGLVVCVILDCCHSGGADRVSTTEGNHGRIRCLSDTPAAVKADPKDRGFRNASLVKRWLYRERKYNLIAACQPSEVAREVNVDGETMGAMTYHFLRSLDMLKNSREPVTYKNLQEVLRSSMVSAGLSQQPMQLGDQTRFLFADNLSQTNPSLFANTTISSAGNLVTLDKGLSSGISVGDRFRLYNYNRIFLSFVENNSNANGEVEIIKVRDTTSTAYFPSHLPTHTDNAWVARLHRRVPTNIQVHLPQTMDKDSHSRLHDEWPSYVNKATPLNLQFVDNLSLTDRNFAIKVDVGQNIFIFYDGEGKEMSNVPPVEADSPTNVRQLVNLLHHLSSYQLVADLNCPHKVDGPRYEFDLCPTSENDLEALEDPEDLEDPPVATLKMRFKNTDTRSLFVTLLNLSPAYGIEITYPEKRAASAEISPNGGFKDELIDITVPDILRPAADQRDGFTMRDTFKLLVTTSLEDFSHFELPDLEADPSKSRESDSDRKARRRRSIGPNWEVVTISITTSRSPRNTDSTADQTSGLEEDLETGWTCVLDDLSTTS
ncbi:Metacaspase-1A [Orbilia brochopaga]|nr:Metacaspase-1A [Drechslerella brochopaga]